MVSTQFPTQAGYHTVQRNQQPYAQAARNHNIPTTDYAHDLTQCWNGYSGNNYNSEEVCPTGPHQAEAMNGQPGGAYTSYEPSATAWRMRQRYDGIDRLKSQVIWTQARRDLPQKLLAADYNPEDNQHAFGAPTPPGGPQPKDHVAGQICPPVQHVLAIHQERNHSGKLFPPPRQTNPQADPMTGRPSHSQGAGYATYRELHGGHTESATRQPILPQSVPLATGWDNPFPVFPSMKQSPRAPVEGRSGASSSSEGFIKIPSSTSSYSSFNGSAMSTTVPNFRMPTNHDKNMLLEIQVLPQVSQNKPDHLRYQRHGYPAEGIYSEASRAPHLPRSILEQQGRVQGQQQHHAGNRPPTKEPGPLNQRPNGQLRQLGHIPQRPETAPPRVDNYDSVAQTRFESLQRPDRPAQFVERASNESHNAGFHRSPDALPRHPAPVRVGLKGNTIVQRTGGPPVGQPASSNGIDHYPRERQSSTASIAPARRRDSLPVTHKELDNFNLAVKSNPSDLAIQLLLAKKMVEAASVLADEGGRADTKTRNRNRERYILDAHKLVKKLVSQGHAEAMFYLGDCYGQGLLGLEVDLKEAFSLYQSAAKVGHAAAAYRTALCCEMGPEEGGGTRKDPLKAVQWYKRASNLGSTSAMYKMGVILLKGLLGQQKNPSEGISWLKRAAERADEENPHALHELGLLYESAMPNDRLVRDEAYALQLFKQAAKLNYRLSQFRLGQAYEYGQLGCDIDARSSIGWYSRAAQKGDHQAELALSGWYLTGSEGILEQSDTESYLWARKAACAEPPLAKAMFAMGYYTEVGIGCPRSLEEAKRWYGRAATYKYPKAQDRLDELKKGGSKAQQHRERLTRINQKQHEAECKVM